MARERLSAGILLFRRSGGQLELLLAHPGGPRFATRDAGCWSIPKGEVEPGEALEAVALKDMGLEAVARREFEEETGHPLGAAELIPLGEIVQKGGKRVHAWAAEGDLDPDRATSNTFVTEWPPGSGQLVEVPEIDRVAWFGSAAARVRIKAAQIAFIDRLEARLGEADNLQR
jgi:predicted NUDIX family NTP pyrophosphohydrolase